MEMSEEYLISQGFKVEFMPNKFQFIIEVTDSNGRGFSSNGTTYEQLWHNTEKEYKNYILDKKLSA